jgi:hypothetical protein
MMLEFRRFGMPREGSEDERPARQDGADRQTLRRKLVWQFARYILILDECRTTDGI